MRLNIEINLDNDEFADSGIANGIERTLENLAGRIALDFEAGCQKPAGGGVEDVNSNTIGHWAITNDKEVCSICGGHH